MGYASGWHDGGENERTTSSLCWSVSPRTQINFQKWWEHVTFQGCKSYRNLAAFQGSPPFKWDNWLVYSTSVSRTKQSKCSAFYAYDCSYHLWFLISRDPGARCHRLAIRHLTTPKA